MEWAEPEHSRRKVNEAGRRLVSDNLLTPYDDEYLHIINNWRSSHSFPLNTFQNGLRRRGRGIYEHCLVAQCIKRLSSIEHKLRRFPTMTLSQMQDIGGCRIVMNTSAQVRRLQNAYLASDIKHALHTTDDYIQAPRPSGYRGLHLIYTYNSDRNATYNGLKIEMQMRSQPQHAWATAVETVGTFVRQALKSSIGEEDWLRFFALMGSALALRERTSPVPNTPTNATELRQELADYSRRLDVRNRLLGYGAALNTLGQPDVKGAHYFVLQLDPPKGEVLVTAFSRSQSQAAAHYYLTA